MSEAAQALESVQKLIAIALELEQRIASQGEEIEALKAMLPPPPIPPVAEAPVRVVTGIDTDGERE